MFNHVSADGYFSAPDGKLDWVIQDPEIGTSAAAASESDSAGTILFGRRTYEQFESFWPHALADTPVSGSPHRPGHGSPELRAMAVYIVGSGSIAALLSQHKLIDEYQFIVSPLLLGKGQSMIGDMPQRVRLDLLDSTAYKSGNVMLRYAPAH